MNKTIFSTCLNPTILRNSIHPCGQCPLCRRKKMLEWILRGTHELNTQNNKAIFITLTYKPRFLPKEGVDELPIIARNESDAMGNLRPNDMTLFFKRLRKYIDTYKNRIKIRYIYCGEYGTLRHRPHYHAIIFGLEPTDITEETFQKIWRMGKVVLDNNIVTEYGIQYTVGYCSKKILDSYTRKKEYYKKGRLPPFLRNSKGIGKDWLMRHKDELLTTGYITYKQREVPIPRYYIKLIKKEEGIIIKWKTTIVERNIGAKKYTRSEYRLVINPFGKNTSRLYQLQREQLQQRIQDAEKDTRDPFYFETIGYLNEKMKQLDNQIKHAVIQWNIMNKFSKNEIAKIGFHKRFKDDIRMSERENNARLWDFKSILSAEYTRKEKEAARLAVYKLMNGRYGQRQAMEISQELQREAI